MVVGEMIEMNYEKRLVGSSRMIVDYRMRSVRE
jgi:hypothetical protein